MKQLNTLIEFKMQNNQLEVANFEAVKSEIEKGLNETYKLFVIQNAEDYRKQKEVRAELNKMSKEINDNKIAWVNDLTLKVKEQTKAICELISAKSKEFDQSIKQYEGEQDTLLGNHPKGKVKYELVIKFTSKEELDKFIEKLPKKIEFTVKEK